MARVVDFSSVSRRIDEEVEGRLRGGGGESRCEERGKGRKMGRCKAGSVEEVEDTTKTARDTRVES